MSTYDDLIKHYSLQVIVIECPYDTYTSSEFTRNLMTNVFNLKFEGYCFRYPYGIMPVSDYDFMATHVCVSVFDGVNYIPISAFKSITSEICKSFRVPFPVINHKFGMFKESFGIYVEALQAWQDQIERNNEVYAYNASWTMKNDLPKELRDLTRQLSLSLFYHHYTSSQIQHVINSTSANFNVNKHQEVMGLKYLKDNHGRTLPAFKSPVFFEEPFYIMYLDSMGFSDIFAKKSEAFKNAWENRIIINKESNKIKRRAA